MAASRNGKAGGGGWGGGAAKTEQRGRKGKRQIELDSLVEVCIMRYSTGSAASRATRFLVRSRSEPPLDSGGHASRRIGISKTIVEACEEQI